MAERFLVNDFCTNVGHELNTQQTARCWSSRTAWAPRRAVGDVRAAERREKTQPFARLTRTLFVRRCCCFFLNYSGTAPLSPLVGWMLRFVCRPPSNKSGPSCLMKSRSGGFSCASGQTPTHIPEQCGQSHCGGVLLCVSREPHAYPGFVSEFSEKCTVRSVSARILLWMHSNQPVLAFSSEISKLVSDYWGEVELDVITPPTTTTCNDSSIVLIV